MCDLHHVALRAKVQTPGRTRFDTSRLKSLAYSIGAECALVDLLRLLIELGNVKRTTGNAIAAANAVLLLKIDDAVLVLDNGAISGARAQATRIFTVHALVLAHEPHQIAVALVLGKLDQVPVVPISSRHCLVRIVECRFPKRMIVPFNTRDFARLTTDTS